MYGCESPVQAKHAPYASLHSLRGHQRVHPKAGAAFFTGSSSVPIRERAVTPHIHPNVTILDRSLAMKCAVVGWQMALHW